MARVPLRARIALFGGGLVALGVLGFALLLNALASQGQPLQQDRDLQQRSGEVLRSIRLADPAQLRTGGLALAPVDLATSSELLVEVYDSSGALLYGNGTLGGELPPVPASLLAKAEGGGSGFATASGIRFHAGPWRRPDLGLSGAVVTGQPTRVVTAGLRGLRTFLLVSAGLTILAALAAAWLIAGRALRPLRQVAATAEEIGRTGDLGRRLPDSDDELGVLASSFNGMLERLAEARERSTEALDAQRRFVADASHELRTPLTSIRTNAGFMVRHPDLGSRDRHDALADIAGEAERMSRLVEDLLTLARADAGIRLKVAPVELGALAEDIARQAARIHPDRVIAADVLPAAPVAGDADSLRQLLWILIDNATRHTSPGGHAWVRSGPGYLAVSDDGTGIPAGELERVFDRFHQADPSRKGNGAGLGLSIAHWIADQHGAVISAANNPERGATITLRWSS